MYIKNFDTWNIVKKNLNENSPPTSVRTGEIRWTALGTNIGSEIDGKGQSSTRPVLILHTIGNMLALIIPMTTKEKSSSGFLPFPWKEQKFSLCIHQIRIVSQKRFFGRKGKVSSERLQEIKKAIGNFFAIT